MRRLAAALLPAFLAACGPLLVEEPLAEDGPASVLRSFLVALDQGECGKAQTLVVDPDVLDCALVEQLAGSYTDTGLDPSEATYEAGERSADSVTVTATFGSGGEPEPWELERVDGTWLVLFESPV